MLIFDGDYPACVAVRLNADLTQPIQAVRAAPPAGMASEDPRYQPALMASVPEQRRAGVVVLHHGRGLEVEIDGARHPGQ